MKAETHAQIDDTGHSFHTQQAVMDVVHDTLHVACFACCMCARCIERGMLDALRCALFVNNAIVPQLHEHYNSMRLNRVISVMRSQASAVANFEHAD